MFYRIHPKNKIPIKFLTFLALFNLLSSSTILLTPILNVGNSSITNGRISTSVGGQQTFLSVAIKQNQNCASLKKGICVGCQDGYYLDENGDCSRVSQNCRLYNTDKLTCTQCYDGYDKINGNCLIPNTSMLLDHCVVRDRYLCQKCDKGYYLTWRGKCVAIDKNCRFWNQSGYCLKCNRGYYSNGLFSCIQNTTLSKTCAQRYFLNANLQCDKVTPNCQTWDYYTGRCLSCYQGFDLNMKYFNCSFSNQCQHCQATCYEFNREKRCITCVSGYILNSKSQCQSSLLKGPHLPPNCLRLGLQTNICEKCVDQYVYSITQKICKFIIQHCKKYSNLNCTQCNEGFFVFNNQCVREAQTISQSKIFGCSIWDFKSQNCLQCNSKWTKNSSGLCVYANITQQTSEIQFCKVLDFAAKQCVDCVVGFTLTSEKNCQKSSTNCAQSDSSNKCILCEDGFLLVNFECNEIEKCESFDSDSGQCNLCAANFILSQGNCYTSQQFGNLIFSYADTYPQKLQSLISITTN